MPLLILAAAFVVLLILAVLFLRPAPFRVERSRLIEAPRPAVFAAVNDYAKSVEWSPWLVAEPDTDWTVEGDGRSVGSTYRWSGKATGKGERKILEVISGERVVESIQFLKPFRSRGKVGFDFADDGDGTQVTWWMEGKIPAIFRKKIEAFIGHDYERGLAMLRERVVTGTVPSRIVVGDVIDCPEMLFWGIPRECSFDEMGPAMEEDFARLMAVLEEKQVRPRRVLTIYENFDLVARVCRYLAAVEIDPDTEASVPDAIRGGCIRAHRAFQVTHVGKYEFLGNAWGAAYTWRQVRGHRLSRSIPPYEVYANDPKATPPEALETVIHLPVTG